MMLTGWRSIAETTASRGSYSYFRASLRITPPWMIVPRPIPRPPGPEGKAPAARWNSTFAGSVRLRTRTRVPGLKWS